ncbi:cytochrome c1 [Hansschlegelia zhihuaiae]|uniref:Cytochrome c1 n=2 Tax=Hansschlegelia zhihuaiae TaxID=405005 RepID=A0A4Q0MJ75_9HYPH|nr:cytochrome c1 [Hansschlegelia zhihuaiae]
MSIRSTLRGARVAAIIIAIGLGFVSADVDRASAAEQTHPPRQSWSFAGPFGRYDQAQLQRGFKIYREVCASCHALSMVAFRNLADEGGLGYSKEQAETIAAEYQVKDPAPDDKGEFPDRPGRLSDYFPSPFPNEEAARAANGGAYPPDFSTLAKARTYERGFPWFLIDILGQYQENGQDYIHALLGGYEEPPHGATPPKDGLHYNKYFPGHWIAMAKPIQDGQVEYADGTPTTIDQYGKDVAAFMTWAAEPHLMARKQMGIVVMFFLIVFAGLLYFTKKSIWHGLKERTA